MATFSGIRRGIETRLKTVSGLLTSPTIPDSIDATPFAFVGPAKGRFVDYSETMDGGLKYHLVARLYVSRWDAPLAQDALDAYVDPTGASSIKAAIEADPTLGLSSVYASVMEAVNYGPYEIGGVTYLGCEFPVEVMVGS